LNKEHEFKLKNDLSLRKRANAFIPGGMWGHMSVKKLPFGYPQFFSKAKDVRIWDLDGNCYIDFMCGYGPNILGYNNSEVDNAVNDQRKKLDLGNGPSALVVDLAEKLIKLVESADWALFAKNGTDATTTCLTISRAATGKKKVLVARGSYHGSAPWCTPVATGVVEEDISNLIFFEYNNSISLEEAAKEAGADLAGIILTAFRHDVRRDQELPKNSFLKKAREICDNKNAVLILDDVRAGFRINRRGSWVHYGVKPDLTAFSKAIGNGYPLSAVVGVEKLRQAASEIYVTGSFWCNATSMAASLKTLSIIEERDVVEHISSLGEKLRSGVDQIANSFGVEISQSGPVQMPLILFKDDKDFLKGSKFVQYLLSKGIYFHPWHNMFLSLAHTAEDVSATLDAVEFAMKKISEEF
jgi:glutamate-1-semialdehyde 2,1-aminomutase